MNAVRLALVAAALTIGAVGPVTGQATAEAVDPVGMYDFIATLGIEMRTGTMEITPDAEGAMAGEVWLEGESDPAVIDDVVVTGSHVQILAYVNNSLPVTFELDFADANTFEGTVTAGNDSIVIDGTRRTE
ncbi:MAG TPA: hypothetical protein VF039_10815 [Longimicrobiales bacterium]